MLASFIYSTEFGIDLKLSQKLNMRGKKDYLTYKIFLFEAQINTLKTNKSLELSLAINF